MQDYWSYLPYLLPPLLGALIGYVTNYIAIRMLFRPLHPWRIFGLRLPLTPGIIPSKRGELALRMGEMVGSHLLTSSDVRDALERPGFQAELRNAVNDKLDTFLDRDLGPVETLIPATYQRRFRDLVGAGRGKLVRLVGDYLQSAEFEQQLRSYLQRQADGLLARDLESFLSPERYQILHQHLDNRISTALQSPELAAATARFVDDRIERLLQSDRPLRDLLPQDLVAVLLEQLEREVPPLLERFGGLLYDPEFRQRLVNKSREGIDSFIDSLGGLAGLLSGFIDLDKVYAKIPEFLDRTAEELARWLREERTQQQVAEMLCDRLEGLLDRSAGSFLEKAPYEKVAGVCRFTRERTVAALQSRRTAELLINLSEQGLQQVKDRSFRSLLDQALPDGGTARLCTLFGDRLLVMLRTPEMLGALDIVLREQLERWLFQHPLGRLSERLPTDIRQELEVGLCRQLGEILQREVPPLVETLNVARMVEEKVNRLDILKVEGLLMGVMQEQFKYINLFGALLGFLIGLGNLAALLLL